MSQLQKTIPISSIKRERILVIKRTDLFQEQAWTGIKEVNFDHYLKLLQKKRIFIPRNEAETDTTYKQVIPYLVFQHDNTYFLMQRKKNSSEQRLANKYSLGIGGHLREEDMAGKTLFDWAQREFKEEINYKGSLEINPMV